MAHIKPCKTELVLFTIAMVIPFPPGPGRRAVVALTKTMLPRRCLIIVIGNAITSFDHTLTISITPSCSSPLPA